MKRILVGVDRSENAACALGWAAGIARPWEAYVVAVWAWSPDQAELPPEEWERDQRAVRAFVDARVRDISVVDPAARGEVVDGAAVEMLLEHARTEDASLLVVGMRGEGGFSRLRLGSVADSLAHHISTPLAVIPDGAPATVRRIVVGVDGSDGARAAVEWSAEFASALGVEVIAVCAYAAMVGRFHQRDAQRIHAEVAEELHTDWVAPLRDAHVPVTEEVVSEPHVADALLTVAESTEADLIVVGTHGLIPVIGMRLGGVAMRLLHETSVPLVLVPPQ